MTDFSDDRCSRLVFCVAIVSAIGLTLPAAGSLPLVLDEQVAYWLCSPTVELSIAERNLNYAAAPPLTSWVQALSLAVLGKSEFALRFPSLACYVLAIVTLFAGTRSVLGGWPAALASLALAWHPDVVDEVRIGRPYGLVLLAMSASLVCTVRLAVVRQRAGEIGWGLGWGVAAGAAMWSHIFTIPVLGCAGLALCITDWRRRRRPRLGTLLGMAVALVAAAPLLSFLVRIWTWRGALNYHTSEAPLWQTCGPFLCLALPLGGFLMAVTRFRRSTPGEPGAASLRGPIGTCFLIGVFPMIALVLAASEHSSLYNARYRVPFAAAQATLLALMLAPSKKSWGGVGLVLAITGSWLVVGRLPTTLARLGTPQAVAWKEIGEELQETVETNGLQEVPVFVQSGLIEGTLVPIMFDDPDFHGYLSSRLGTFYADVPNPRLGLPFFWQVNSAELQTAFRSFVEAPPGPQSGLFIAVAVDTDVNRGSLAGFVAILNDLGYEMTLITDHSPWAVLYHARRRNGE